MKSHAPATKYGTAIRHQKETAGQYSRRLLNRLLYDQNTCCRLIPNKYVVVMTGEIEPVCGCNRKMIRAGSHRKFPALKVGEQCS